MPEDRSTVNKTSLQQVWRGTDAQLQDLQHLVLYNSKIMMHGTHFMKFHSLSNNYFEYDNNDVAAILALLNNSNCRRMNYDKFLQSMLEYKGLVGFEGERLKYFDNFASYHGRVLLSQYLNNIQEHFVQMVKRYCTFLIVERFKRHVPVGMTQRQHLSNLRTRATRVQNSCLSREVLPQYHNMAPYDMVIVDTIRNILPENINARGVAYDVVAKPEKYAEGYYQLGLLYSAQEMHLFNVFPLATSFIPRHMIMDTTLLCRHVLGMRGTDSSLQITERKFEYWSQVVNLKNKAFKKRSRMNFQGVIRTDGVSISVILDSKEVHGYSGRKRRPKVQSEYFQDHVDQIRENKVVFDLTSRSTLIQIEEICSIAWVPTI